MADFKLKDLREEPFWYLATPYRKYPGGHHAAWQEACKAAQLLIKQGVRVFCPIAHSHGIDLHFPEKDHYAVWLPQDSAFIHKACGIIVVKMKTWEKSFGIQEEIEAFRKLGKPVLYMDWK